jgi:peroxiredoxin
MTPSVSSPSVSDPAPPLDLPRIDGGRLNLEDLRGRPVLVSFLRHAG